MEASKGNAPVQKEIESLVPTAIVSASVSREAAQAERMRVCGRYNAVCVGPVEGRRDDFNVLAAQLALAVDRGSETEQRELRARLAEIPLEEKWHDEFDNLVTTEGKNDNLTKYLTGSGYTATWYMGLISSVGYTTGAQAADVAAQINGTNAWKEANTSTNFPLYSGGVRPTPAWAAASGGSKATSSAVSFSIVTTGGTVKGCFLASVSTLGGTTGTLYSAGVFTGGDKIVAPGDTLQVSYTATLT